MKHTAVIKSSKEFVPCTETGKDKKEREEHPNMHLRIGNLNSNAHEAKEHERLTDMKITLECPSLAHFAIEIGLRHPRKKEQSTTYGGNDRGGTKLHKHDQRHKHHNGRRNLSGGTKGWDPNPRTIEFTS